jgi:membrane protease YdiL (CAAX protease family)
MNFELNYFLIVFIILLIILTILYPIIGAKEVKKLKQSYANGNTNIKVKFFRESIISSWIPIILIFSLIPISDVSLADIGLKWNPIYNFSLSKWIVYPVIGFYLLHLFQNIYHIIVFKSNTKKREKVAKNIPGDYKWFLPITNKEKQVWSYLSISAGITEEILYRGYFFFALAIIFPALNLVSILLITTLIFGIGHIYLGKEVIKSTLLGLIFGIYYIAFDSVIPVIIIHIAQDLVIRDIIVEE